MRDELIRTTYKDIKVVIAGEGPAEKQLRDLSRSLGLDHAVEMPGFISPERLEEEFNNSDLFLVPGRQGFGLPVLEALYREVPVVLNRESRVSEILKGTGLAGIAENSLTSFSNQCIEHILKVRDEEDLWAGVDVLPTEQGWASTIGEICDWW